jgi:hypothetical protein
LGDFKVGVTIWSRHQLILQKTKNEIPGAGAGATPGVGVISFQIYLGGVGVTLTLRDGNSKNKTLKKAEMKCHSGVSVYTQC